MLFASMQTDIQTLHKNYFANINPKIYE